MKNYKIFKREILKDKKVEKAYQELGFEFSLIEALIKRRLEEVLTQKDLAISIGTKQSSIARFESGEYNPTISFLNKIVNALNADLKIVLK